MAAEARRRSHWGWGFEGAGGGEADAATLLARAGPVLGPAADALRFRPARPLGEVTLPEPRVQPPDSLAPLCSAEAGDRARHAYGRGYADLVRGHRGEYPHPPDLVARPRDEAELAALLDWCGGAQLAAIPFGGGTSVVQGVEPDLPPGYRGAVTLDLERLGRLLEVDGRSQCARVQAGMTGPALEAALAPHGLTLRHYPQSFELSTVGGWIATRAGGHFATGPTHIDDFVAALRVVTPRGVVETRRLPGSGAGPSPDRLFIGSEGALGIITEAWLRLQRPPVARARASARFATFTEGAEAARAIAQARLQPANLRLLDPLEAMASGAARDGAAVLLIGFESPGPAVGERLREAVALAEAAGGRVGAAAPGGEAGGAGSGDGGEPGAADAWKRAFLKAPYLMNAAVCLGLMVDTFETAVPWDRFRDLHEAVGREVGRALGDLCGGGLLMCRLTHVYPDGAAPYYTFLAPAVEGAEIAVWQTVRQVAAEAVLAAGGTITHHHAVGRLHRPWYDRQRPPLFGEALAAAKATLDPAGVLNPGVLLDAAPAEP